MLSIRVVMVFDRALAGIENGNAKALNFMFEQLFIQKKVSLVVRLSFDAFNPVAVLASRGAPVIEDRTEA